MKLDELPLAQRLEAVLAHQRTAYRAHPVPTLAERLDDLKRLREFLRENLDDLCEAVSADYGHRSRHETLLCGDLTAVDGVDPMLRP